MKIPSSYANTRSKPEFIRSLILRIMHLNRALADLDRFARKGEDLLIEGKGAGPDSPLSPFIIRASVIVMACSMVEGFLVDLVEENRGIESLPPVPPAKSNGKSTLDRVELYFTTVAQLRFPSQSPAWNQARTIFLLRNALVHSLGRPKPKQRLAVGGLPGVTMSPTGEAWLESGAPTCVIQVFRQLAHDMEECLGGAQ